MGWTVYPEGLGEVLTDLKLHYGNPPVIVTECGSAWTDTVTEGTLGPEDIFNETAKEQ